MDSHNDAVIEESENAAFDHTERPRHLWPASRKGPGPLGPKAWGPEAEDAEGAGHDANASTYGDLKPRSADTSAAAVRPSH